MFGREGEEHLSLRHRESYKDLYLNEKIHECVLELVRKLNVTDGQTDGGGGGGRFYIIREIISKTYIQQIRW